MNLCICCRLYTQVTDEISMGGALDGYPSSYIVDIDSFKFRHEYKYILGSFEDQLNIGDVYNSDVIGKSIQTLDAALDPKYWQFMSYYASQGMCASDASNNLATWKANIIQALKAYPSYKQATATASRLTSHIRNSYFSCEHTQTCDAEVLVAPDQEDNIKKKKSHWCLPVALRELVQGLQHKDRMPRLNRLVPSRGVYVITTKFNAV